MQARLVLETLMAMRFAIELRWLEAITDIVQRESNSAAIQALQTEAKKEAVSARTGASIDGARNAELRGSVGVLHIHGPISRRAGMFDDICALTSIERIATDLTALRYNRSVKSILLDFDTPGGSVDGASELAAMIREIDTEKPVYAYANDTAASLGYWLASAARTVVAAKTSALGSIGVVAMIRDKKDKDTIQFVSSQSPKKRPDLQTVEGRKVIEDELDYLAGVFIEDIAAYRGVTTEYVLENFGQGGVISGQAAVDAGLADRLGSYEGLIKEMNDAAQENATVNFVAPKKKQPSADELERENEMGLIDKLKALIGEEDKTAEGQTAKDSENTNSDVKKEAEAKIEVQPAPVAKEAQGALLAANKRAFEAEATAAYLMLRSANKIAPVEENDFKKNFVRCAMDDYLHPVAEGETSRVEALTEAAAKRPAHKFTEELLPGKKEVLPAAKQGSAAKDGEITAEREEELLNLTQLGRRASDAAKNGTGK